MPADPGTGSRQPRPTRPTPRPTLVDPVGAAHASHAASTGAHRTVEPGLPEWVVRRQRLLRARGYSISIDGVWGPQSQHAWALYTAKATGRQAPAAPAVRPAPKGPAPLGAERNNLLVQQAVRNARIARRAADAEARVRALRKEMSGTGPQAQRDFRHHENVLTDKHLAASRVTTYMPRLRQAEVEVIRRTKTPEQMTAHELLATTVDPATSNFDVQNPHTVKTIQRWLKQHGKHSLAVDGVYGPQTFKALRATFDDIAATEHRQAVSAVKVRFFDSGVMKRHENDPTFPLAHVPDPGELLATLQSNTFTAGLLYRWLEAQRLKDVNLGLDHGYAKWRDDFLQRAAINARGSFTGQLARDGKPLVPFTPAQLATIDPATLTVLDAGSFEELRKVLREQQVKQERDFQQRMQAAASHKRGFWGSIGAGLSWVADRGTESATAVGNVTVSAEMGTARGARGDFSHPVYDPTPDEALARAHMMLSEAKEEHPIVTMLIQMTTDPLNFVPGKVFTAPFIGAVRGGVILERAGFRIATSSGRIRNIPLGLALQAPAHSTRAFATALDSTAASVTARLAFEATRYPGNRTMILRPITRAYIGAKHATQLKTTAEQAVFRVTRNMRRRNFDPMSIKGAQNAALLAHQAFEDGSGSLDIYALKRLSTTEGAQRALVDTVLDGRLGKVIRKWALDGLSLYAHADQYVPSIAGHHLLASLKERVRVETAQDIAEQDARVEATRIVGHSAGPLFESKLAELTQRNLERFGTHYRGGIDPHYDAALEHASAYIYRRLEDSVLPTIQRRIVEVSEQAGIKMWGEDGAWIGSEVLGAAEDAIPFVGTPARFAIVQQMKADARANFEFYSHIDQTVKNPLFDRFFLRADAERMMESEIERRVAAAEFAAEVAQWAGKPWAKGELDRVIEAIQRDVHESWDEVTNDITRAPMMTDKREFVPAPRIYTRHLGGDAALDPAEILFPGDPKLIDNLSMLASREGTAPGADAPEFLQTLDAYRRNVSLHMDALDEATSLTRQALLRRQGLFLSAIRAREAGPFRIIYKTFESATAQWKFLTLPLRAAWTVRNVADNTIKVLLQGVVDPRAWFAGGESPGAATASIFAMDLRAMRETVNFIERTAGLDGRATAAFDGVIAKVMSVNERVLSGVFGAHGIPVPEALIREARFANQHGGPLAKWQDSVWELMGNRPEAYFKRVLYRDTYRKALDDGADTFTAAKIAWARVEATLFDYSKITTLESNLAIFAPFIQFWRKNTVFWLKTFAQKPWFLEDLSLYQEGIDEAHKDDPQWLRRYLPLHEVVDAAASVPGLDFVVDHILGNTSGLKKTLEDTAYDPLNFFSFAPLYRTFKNENPLLPADRAGMKFIGPLVDAMNDWGLGLNPFFRKPLEMAGVLNFRAWQAIFPQTPLIQAFTREHARGLFGDQGFNIEAWLLDPVLDKLGQEDITTLGEQSFNQYVQQEMTGQVARGERPSRERAEQKIRQFLYVQTLIGYFGGAYLRRMTPQDVYLQQLSDSVNRAERDYSTLSTHEKELYKAWSLRKANPVQFENYMDATPAIRAYYELHDFQAREEWKQEHPEIIPFVERAFSEKLPPESFAVTQRLISDTQLAFEQADFARTAKLDFLTRKSAEDLYVNSELRAFWSKNDTPREIRDRMLRGYWQRHVTRMNDTFFAIPATDYDAKKQYLDDNPILWDEWQQNNTAADDLSSIMHQSNSSLRERYFELLDAKDYNSARDFLHRFPFIFEDTSAADRVDPNTGEWKYGSGKGGHSGSTPKARAYLAAKPGLDYLFNNLATWAQRSRWLVSDDPRAASARTFLSQYDGWAWRNGRFAPAAFWNGKHQHGMTQHARDYLAVKGKLSFYFNLLKSDKDAAERWLNGDSDGAKEVRSYFDKWASKGGMTAHAKAFLDAKKQLNHYFALGKDERRDWLKSGSPDAAIVAAYFKKWGHQSKQANAWTKGDAGWARTANPELAKRLEFWQRYWQLSPQDRPAYVSKFAVDAGVYVYGVMGDRERHDQEKSWLRTALLHGVKSHKAALYLRAKPLLDIYFTLEGGDQALFARANPEVQEYLDAYSTGPSTGNKKLDGLVDHYFKLPQGSQARSDFLHAHPDVQHYFDEKSTPAERATRDLLNLYFSFPPSDRNDFALRHPEIQAYFDKKKMEHNNAIASALAFDTADPRLKQLVDLAATDITQPALELRAEMRRRSRQKEDSLSRRTERQPLKPPQ